MNSDSAQVLIELNDDSLRMLVEDIRPQCKIQHICKVSDYLAVVELDESWLSRQEYLNLLRYYFYLRNENSLVFCTTPEAYRPNFTKDGNLDSQFDLTRITTDKFFAIIDIKDLDNNIVNIIGIFNLSAVNENIFAPGLAIKNFVPIDPINCAIRKNTILNAITVFCLGYSKAHSRIVKYIDVTIPAIACDEISAVKDIFATKRNYKINKFIIAKETKNDIESAVQYIPEARCWLMENAEVYRLTDVLVSPYFKDKNIPELMKDYIPNLNLVIKNNDENAVEHIISWLNKFNIKGIYIANNNTVVLYRIFNNCPVQLLEVISDSTEFNITKNVLTIFLDIITKTNNHIPLLVKSISPSDKDLPIYSSLDFKVTLTTHRRTVIMNDYDIYEELINTEVK